MVMAEIPVAEVAQANWPLISGTVLAWILFLIKVWETFFRDKLRLVTTYSFNSLENVSDTISIVNLSPVPVMVSHWSLEWKPRWFRQGTKSIDVTPDFDGLDTTGLKIAPHDYEAIEFAGLDKFDWGHKTATGRRLILTLHLFGRRRPIALVVHRGL